MLSYRKLAMRVLGRPLHTEGIDSPRPASQRAAAFILTAAMLTTLAAPAFADIWHIENGDITISAGESGNNVTQNNNTTYGDTNTIITNQNKDTASSHTVTIEAKDKDDKVEVTLKDVNIDTSSRNKAAVSVTGEGDTNIKLDGDNALKSDIYRSGIYGSGSLTISGGENDSLTAQGGSGANGISSSGSLTISGGTVTANGDDGGRGISSSGSVTISGGSTAASSAATASAAAAASPSPTVRSPPRAVTATAKTATAATASAAAASSPSPAIRSTPLAATAAKSAATASAASTVSPSPAVRSKPLAVTAAPAAAAASTAASSICQAALS